MQLEQGLVSVVMLSYNHGQFIGQTFESLINQTYENIELIILDDGSCDNTREIILNYKERLKIRFKRVEVIFKENEGICKTINKGLRITNGEFYYLIASDDILMSDFVLEHVNFLSLHRQYACSYSDGLHIRTEDINKHDYNKGIKFSADYEFFSGDYRSFILEHGNLIKLPTTSFLYRKSILTQLGMYDENLDFEDADMFIRITRKYKIGAINKILCIHRLHPNNTGRNMKKMATAMKQLYYKYQNDTVYNSEERTKLLNYLKMYFEWDEKSNLLDTKAYINFVRGRKLVLWGASGGGMEFLKKHPGIQIDFFVDSQKEGSEFEGYLVKNPLILEGKSNEYYIITTVAARYYLEVRDILKEYGYSFGKDHC